MNKTALLVGIAALLVVEAGGVLFLGIWRDWYWSAIADKNYEGFIHNLALFSVVALVLCVVYGLSSYMSTLWAIHKRSELTQRAFKTYEQNKHVEGFEQRYQEDCLMYPTLLINLVVGLIRCLLQSAVAVYIILSHISAWYLLVPLVYAACNTGIAMLIAHPLINLNYLNQVAEAALRKVLTQEQYSRCTMINLEIARKTKHLSYFQTFYNQITVIVPILILAPSYFSGVITFGILMQQSAAIKDLIQDSSYALNSFDIINRYISCKKRLRELQII